MGLHFNLSEFFLYFVLLKLHHKYLLALLVLFCALINHAQVTERKIDSLEKLIIAAKNVDEKLLWKSQIAVLLIRGGNYDESERVFREALKETKGLAPGKGLATFWHNRGNLFYYISEFDSSLFYYEKGLSMRREIGDKEGELKSLNNIGGIYYMLNEHQTALKYYEEGLRKEAELGFEEGSQVYLSNLGTIYTSLKLYDKALTYFRKSFEIYRDNPKDLHVVYQGFGIVYKETKQYDSSEYYLKLALKSGVDAGVPSQVAYTYVNLATLYNMQMKYGLALESLKQAKAIRMQDPLLEMSIVGNMAAIYIDQKNMDSAMIYMEELIRLEKLHKIEKHQEDLSKIYAYYYIMKKDYAKGFDYFEIYEQHRDSIYNLETVKQINEMQEKYESEKKEKANQLLQVENKSYRTTRNYLYLILAIVFTALLGAFVAYSKIRKKNNLLDTQNRIIEESQKEILDSIQYARRIQFALLASDTLLQKHLPEHFVLFKPKAVVSGDFYWAIPTEAGFIYITGDCTGHGVPGAFMSLLFITTLRQTITEFNIQRPDLILNKVREQIVRSLNPEGSKEESKDGMDAVVCLLDPTKRKLMYAAANNAFYVVRNSTLLTFKADKMPVGKSHGEPVDFTYNDIQLEKGDVVYTFTDGFADQFGGPAGKKFKYKQFETLLLEIHEKPMADQKKLLDTTFENWRGNLEQVDDVCIIGVKIN